MKQPKQHVQKRKMDTNHKATYKKLKMKQIKQPSLKEIKQLIHQRSANNYRYNI